MNLQAHFLSQTDSDFEIDETTLGVEIAPHQSRGTFDGPQVEYRPINAEVARVGCTCTRVESHSRGLPTLASIFDDVRGRAVATIVWMDPTALPLSCLARNVSEFLRAAPSHHTCALGIRAYSSSTRESSSDDWISAKPFWKPNGGGSELSNPIWYVDLSNPPERVISLAEKLRPMEIFPLVEFPVTGQPESRSDWVRHRALLEEYHVRTERFIRYSNQWVEETCRNLANSMAAHSRSIGVSRAVTITLGSPGPAYLALVAATVAEQGYFAMDPSQVPFLGGGSISGSVLLRVRPE
jgi:hypothetical protein